MSEFECPTCGRQFDTRRGLGVHHVAAHDERLPNRTCANCGRSFYSGYEKKYCSPGCLKSSVSFEGENNPNYRAAKKVTNCRLCGSEFEYYPSDKKGLYCAECVDRNEWQTTPGISGPDNPRWSGGKRTVSCTVCGEAVERYPSDFESEVVLCSAQCKREWLSDAFVGEGHPNWKGGSKVPYGRGWARVRKQALRRDGYRCRVCQKSKDDIGRNPDVHHIVPLRTFIESDEHEKEDAHTLDNVVSLCVDCHRKADFGNISAAKLRALIQN